MNLHNVNVFHQDIIGFFFTYFSEFEFFPGNPNHPAFHPEAAFYHNYRKYGLSIVVELPIEKDGKNWRMTGKKIRIFLKKTRDKKLPYLVELTDTLIRENYHDLLRKRIGALKELIDEIHECQKCKSGTHLIPEAKRTNDNKRTWFVSLQCPSCHRYTPTTFGRGLKTRLHRNLKKTRTH